MITIELSVECGQYQLSINDVDERGAGHGYRIFGPKFAGGARLVKSVTLTDRDKQEIARYLRPSHEDGQ